MSLWQTSLSSPRQEAQLHNLVSKSPLSLVSQLCAHPLRGSPTSDLDPSPSLWVLIIGLSVKRQRPSSPAGHRCQSGLRYAEGQQRRETERDRADQTGGVCGKKGETEHEVTWARHKARPASTLCHFWVSQLHNPKPLPWPLTHAYPIVTWRPDESLKTNKQMKGEDFLIKTPVFRDGPSWWYNQNQQ